MKEYKTVRLKQNIWGRFDPKRIDNIMNDMSKDGWEFVEKNVSGPLALHTMLITFSKESQHRIEEEK